MILIEFGVVILILSVLYVGDALDPGRGTWKR